MTQYKIVAAIDDNLRILKGDDGIYIIEESLPEKKFWSKWTTIKFYNLWEALSEVAKELCYREKRV
jgi:hypothetical protein